MTLGELLKAAREAAGLSRTEAAERCGGMDRTTYWRLEQGERGRRPARATLEALSKGLGIPMEDLEACLPPKPVRTPKPMGRPRELPKRREAVQAEAVRVATTTADTPEMPKELAALPPVMSIEEAAAFLRVSRGTLYRGLKEQAVPTKRIGRRRVVIREALWRWLTA